MKTSLCCFGPGFFVCAGYILSLYATYSCRFYDVVGGSPIQADAFGIFCYTSPVGGNEWGYPSNFAADGTPLKTVQSIAVANTIIGFCAMIVACFSCLFCCCKRIMWFFLLLVGLMALANSGLEGAKFILGNSEICANGSCALGTGAKCCIAAAVCYFVSAFFFCGRGKEVKEEHIDDDDEEKQ